MVNVYKYLTVEKKECILSKQLLPSGTSIGANIKESSGGHIECQYKFYFAPYRSDKYYLRIIILLYGGSLHVFWLFMI